MFPQRKYRIARQTLVGRTRRKINRPHSERSTKRSKNTTKNNPSFIERFQQALIDLRRPGSRVLTYSIPELEEICEQLAIQQMASAGSPSSFNESCPLICLFCQYIIFEPITLPCGHTYCYQCIKDDQISSTANCPRCPKDIQGQVQSTIVCARVDGYDRNRFLHQVFDRHEKIKIKQPLLMSYHAGRTQISNGNYQQAVDTFSEIINQDSDNHLAFYGRAKAYMALKQFDSSLTDATRVVKMKPQWSKGYICQSEILFELRHLTAALTSSLKALVIDPDDPLAKPTMARHMHAVLHDSDEREPSSAIQSEIEKICNENTQTANGSSSTEDNQSNICKFTNKYDQFCYCSYFDCKNIVVQDFECSICTSLLWFPITTPCGHVFCRECLIRSVDNTRIKCPICNGSLDKFFPMVIECHVNKTELICKLIETFLPTENAARRELYEQERNQGTSISQFVNNDANEIAATTLEIPIFVCVLALPYCACPLHVFEPRYRLMMRRTIETESRVFGMCTFDETTGTFSDYGTLLYIRTLLYTPDGRSIVDTIGQRRFRVLERGVRDGYSTAKVVLIRDSPIEEHEFNDLSQMNRTTYDRVQNWYNHLDAFRRTLIARQLDGYPTCDDLVQGSTDGPSWAWIMLNLLPIDPLLQYTAVASQSLRVRLQMINDVIDFFDNHHQQQHQQSTPASSDAQ